MGVLVTAVYVHRGSRPSTPEIVRIIDELVNKAD